MKTYINIIQKTKITGVALAAIGLITGSSHAQTVLGSFQGSSDPLNAGWINPNTSNPITTDPADSFVAAGVVGYSQSLQVTGTAGSFGSDSLELQFSPTQIAAFNANSYMTFTFSVPAWTSGGFSQIYNLALNAPVYGFNNVGDGNNKAATWGSANFAATGTTSANSSGQPGFFFFNGSPLQTQTVTFNYSSILPAIEAGGEGFLQMTFQGNQGGGAPAFIYMNNVVLSTGPFGVDPVPEPTTNMILVAGGSIIVLILARRRSIQIV